MIDSYFFRPRVGFVENDVKRSVVTCIVPAKEMKNPTALSISDKYLTATQ